MNDLDPEPRIESRIEPRFEPGFDQLYRAASTEQPGAAADAAILALAHAAAAETRAAAPARTLRRWRTPLGLAASLVLAAGIVSRVQVEQEAATAPGSAPAPAPSVPASVPASVPPSVPASVPPSVPAPAPVSAPVQASEPSSAPAGGQGRIQAPAVAPLSPAQSGVNPEALEKRKALADSVVTAEDSVRKESGTPARESGDSKRSQPLASAGAGGAANSASAPAAAAASAAASSELSAAATASAPAPAPKPAPASASAPAQSPQPVPLARAAAPAVAGEAQRDDTMGSRAAVAPQRRPAAAGSTVLNQAIEAALTPEQWLRRIIDARRGGRDDEADASLKRFIAHHPAQPVPPEARRGVE